MTLAEFKQAPWRTSHKKYSDSALAIVPAPEYASSEVLVSSLYRTIGFEAVSEGSVPQAGKDHDKFVQKHRDKKRTKPEGALVEADTWSTIIHGVLESPKLPNQSSKRFLQVSPLVPGLAVISGSARLSRNSWHAGGLIRRMIWLGSKDASSASALWADLFSAMDVGENDDVFARWLREETNAWTAPSPSWQMVPPAQGDSVTLAGSDFDGLQFPARQFTKDLAAIVAAKNSMTRRQWISLLEAILRLAAVSHVTWLCDVQARIWRNVQASLSEEGAGNSQGAVVPVFPPSPLYMAYGSKALSGFKDKASSYLQSRLGINTVLWALDDVGQPYVGSLSSSEDVTNLCRHIRQNQAVLASTGITKTIADVLESEGRALLCKKGIGANLTEFARHCLGQRQSASPLLRGYDQGYVLRKNGTSAASPWVVSLGPVSVLALVHCALFGMGGPRSIQRLVQHLAAYGVTVDRNDIASSDLGHQLRMLGLVLDSPDAESGMLLLPPFPTSEGVAA
ncbi:hypothetical protein [Ralstonia pseudosolanacearum]|uniref:hypothetical protein n=1 Tax=Ralstonia pseudosolanacearum TaxID=1310165 RepID=UPI002676398C|nr:hypothetical protein [Ralstonia pseudosolanacearum]MDO3506880.1 hypothetical protein [Ralstonia pseudosolanacearum]MDO3512910.1 hypothetical protein [Ralstonia pseudosolanacearum]MDO3536305.1 hypothetical protein [Ralstonia pseudosolanacearum]MDO3630463.1 hypothetical protein [Ralstonia pseudosolanacearum]